MQNIQLIGNIGKDAEINVINNDRKAINFNLAVNEIWKDEKGAKTEKTTWYACTLWKNKEQSTEIAQYLKKGTKLYIGGKPIASYYVNKESGEIVANINVDVKILEFLKKRGVALNETPLVKLYYIQFSVNLVYI